MVSYGITLEKTIVDNYTICGIIDISGWYD